MAGKNRTDIPFKQCTPGNYLNHYLKNMSRCFTPEFISGDGDVINNDQEYHIYFQIKDKKKFNETFSKASVLYVAIYTKDVSITLDNYYNQIKDCIRIYKSLLDFEIMNQDICYLFFTYGITEVMTIYSWFLESNRQTTQNLNLFDTPEEIIQFGRISL